MSEVFNVLGGVAMSAAKSVAAQEGNKVLCEGIKAALKKSNLVSDEMLDNPMFEQTLRLVAPALIFYAASAHKDLIAGQIGEANAERVSELAKLALQGESTAVIKPIMAMAVPMIKGFLTAGVDSMKELKSGKSDDDGSFVVSQID